jgi:uncharacterized protein YydD (DUF2326 family)
MMLHSTTTAMSLPGGRNVSSPFYLTVTFGFREGYEGNPKHTFTLKVPDWDEKTIEQKFQLIDKEILKRIKMSYRASCVISSD